MITPPAGTAAGGKPVHTSPLRRNLLAIGSALILAALAIVVAASLIDRRDTIAASTVASSNLGIALAEQLERSMEAVDAALRATAEMVASLDSPIQADREARLAGSEMRDFLVRRSQNLSQVEAISVVTAEGKLLNTSRMVHLATLSVAGRDYYKYFVSHDDAGVFINPPVRSVLTDAWTFILARRVNRSDGQLLGMVVGVISINYFEAFYRAITQQDGTAVTVLRRDGVIMAHYPASTSELGARMPAGTPWYQVAAQGGTYRSPGYLDGRSRFVSVHPLHAYPLVVDVSIAEEVALAAWRMRLAALCTGAGAGVGSLILLLVLLTRQFRRLEASELSLATQNSDLEGARAALECQAGDLRSAAQALSESERCLIEKSALLEVTLEQMAQGIMLVDPDRNVVLCNRRVMTMLDLPAEMMMRRPAFAEVLARLWQHDGTTGSADDFIRPGGLLDHPHVQERRRPNGLVIEVRSIPFAGGSVVRTYTDITDLVRARDRLNFTAQHDGLTGLANRALFRDRLEQELEAARRSGFGVAVLFLDLDRFKLVNDTRGHAVGDKLLIEVARRVAAGLREDDTAARFGGDEFAVLQVEVGEIAAAAALAGRLVAALGEPFLIDGLSASIGVSIGVALFPDDGRTADALMRNADTAMYRAKESGRSTFRLFEPAMDVRQQERVALERDLRAAIAQQRMHVVYQPICDAVSTEPVGFEALLRWHHPTRGAIEPKQFIPLAEELGLIVPLGLWVLEQACTEAARWSTLPDGGCPRVGVNLSPLQFRQPDLAAEIDRILQSTGCTGHQLDVEVTEGLLLHESAEVLDTMRCLKASGIRLILDDFGIGNAGLSYLRRFPFDKIKVDQFFIQNMATDESTLAIVEGILTLSKRLGLEVVAEGVETRQQLEMLRALGCDQVQGYLTGRPVAGARVPAILDGPAAPGERRGRRDLQAADDRVNVSAPLTDRGD